MFKSKAMAWWSATIFLFPIPLIAQDGLRFQPSGSTWRHDYENESEGRRFYQNFYEGLRMGLQRSDLTLMTASIILEQQDKWQGWSLPPSQLDRSLSSELARSDGKGCLGAISPLYYPRAVATFRLGGVLMLDAVGGQDFSPTTYFKLIRFHQALLYNATFTHLAKRNLSRSRPDGTDTQSFFSGHASTVFATSTFLYLELRDYFSNAAAEGKLPLLSEQNWKRLSGCALFGWAAYVGYSRVHDRKHYPTDVLVGALSGTLISYFAYPHEKRLTYSNPNKLKFGAGLGHNGLALRVDF